MRTRANQDKETKTMKLRKIATLAALAATGLLTATSGNAFGAFGDGYDVADINSSGNQTVPAFPGTKAFWAGTCDLGAAPPLGEPIPGGVGPRPEKISLDRPRSGSISGIVYHERDVFLHGLEHPVFPVFIYPPGTKLWDPAVDAPEDPAHCIDYGLPNDSAGNVKSPSTGESWEPTPNDPEGWWTDLSAEGGAGETPFEPSWRLPAVTEVGAHPDGTASFALKRNGGPAQSAIGPDGAPDNVGVALPAGFAGNPTAVPKCTAEEFAVKPSRCPPESQVGMATISLTGPPTTGVQTNRYPVYNLEPREGYTAELGIPAVSTLTSVRIVAKARTASDFGVTGWVAQIPGALPLFQQALTLWGVPWAPEHDLWRVKEGFESGDLPLTGLAAAEQAPYDPSWGDVRPFLSNITGPSDPADPCDGTGAEPNTLLTVDTFQNPGGFDSDGEPDLSNPNWVEVDSPAPPLTGCEAVGFDPDIALELTTSDADTPTGLGVELRIPQNNDAPVPAPGGGASQGQIDEYLADVAAFWRSGAGRATSHLRDTTVTLPEGMTLNPAAAAGQGACSMDQIGVTDTDSPVAPRIRFDNSPVECPDSSKVAEVVVETPLLDPKDYPTGHVYLAKQGDNPFDSDFAIYIALQSPERGFIAKLAGEVSPDPDTGQLKTTFADNPPLPFERFSLRFKGGDRAPLATPPTCGTHASSTSLAPYSNPGDPVVVEDPFQLSSSPVGGCPGSGPDRPLDPGFTAGSANPMAGAHTPFTVRLTRPDGNQELDRVEVTTPEGFAARLKGVPYCPESGIAHAAARTATGDGEEERRNPSCPAASQIGTTTIGAGAGDDPFYVEGKVYLAGPYKGAPVSLAFVVPAVAGPFDLGVQVVRAAVNVNPSTAQLTTVSDEIPEILRGVPLRIRDIRVEIDKPSFAVNPTDCSAQLITGKVSGASGAEAEVSNRFQVGACRDLAFGPRIKLRLFGGIKRAKYQGLRAVVRPKPGEANISRTVVRMPRSAFLAQEHLKNICTRVQWAADACPKNSIYGRAIAYSPLLDFPLRGNVHLRSSDNLLPDLVADLRGPAHQPIRIELVGRTDSVKGALRNTFDVVPDAPVSYFRLQLFGGQKGLIVNSRNICRGKNRAGVRFDAQNGRRQIRRPLLFNRRCAVLAKKRRAQRRKAKRSAHRRASRTRQQRANR